MQTRRLPRWRVTRVPATALHGPYAIVQLMGEVTESPPDAPDVSETQRAIYATETVLVPLDSLDEGLYPDTWIVTHEKRLGGHEWRAMP